MKTSTFGVLIALALAFVPGVGTAAPAPASATATAMQLLDHLDAGEFDAAEAMFSEKMAAAVPAARLEAVWRSLPAQAGAAKGRGEATLQAQGDMQMVVVPLHYENAELVAKFGIDADGKVAGFLIQPAQAPAPPPPPAGASYEERETHVGDGDTALPATLAIPKGDAPGAGFPAVVLVHGSGPQDRDETIGPNRPFLDIARGLAAQGIAVLRYDKRSKARPQDYRDAQAPGNGITIDTETTDDAVAAIGTLAAGPGIDPARIFVLGHSQGGMMAPRIASHAAEAGNPVAGLILMAAPTRKLLDILVEQNQRMAVLDDGHTSEAEAEAIAKLRAQVKALRGRDAVAADDTPMRLPAGYWRSTDQVDAVAEAEAAGLPMLVLQGARDIQVVDADWQGWKAAFHDDPNATFKLYPSLNHLGIAGEGEGSPAEYSTPGHVDRQLVDDIARWIDGH